MAIAAAQSSSALVPSPMAVATNGTSGSGLSTGAVTGLTVGAIFAAFVCALLGFVTARRLGKGRPTGQPAKSFDWQRHYAKLPDEPEEVYTKSHDQALFLCELEETSPEPRTPGLLETPLLWALPSREQSKGPRRFDDRVLS